MRIKITLRYFVAMLMLMMISGEIHEQVHINTGYLLCGSYGERDFSVWQTAQSCYLSEWSFLPAASGPLYSFLVIWIGAILLLKAKSGNFQVIGFSLIFAPLPFARIFTALIGGGDEKMVFLNLFQDYFSPLTCKILAAVFVTAICLPPILIARWKIKNRFAWLYIIGLCVLPLIILGVYVKLLLNSLLASGFLSSTKILGTPTLILVHSFLITIILLLKRHWLLFSSPRVNYPLPVLSEPGGNNKRNAW